MNRALTKEFGDFLVLKIGLKIKFCSHFSYASVGNISEGYIEIPTMAWPDFITRYNLKKIDLLKMNIEGAEKDLIASIDDFSIIKRFIISCVYK